MKPEIMKAAAKRRKIVTYSPPTQAQIRWSKVVDWLNKHQAEALHMGRLTDELENIVKDKGAK